MKHELRVMQAQGSGSIVNISSSYGHEGGAGASVYAASKHAVEGMTKSVALEVAQLRRAGQRDGAGADRDRECSTASPAPRRGRRRWPPECRWGAWASRTEIARAIVFLASARLHS